jgi:hypothetical protein
MMAAMYLKEAFWHLEGLIICLDMTKATVNTSVQVTNLSKEFGKLDRLVSLDFAVLNRRIAQ